MPRLAGCLIGFHSRLVVNLAGLKCGKDKLIEVLTLLLVCSFGFFGLKTYFVAERLYSVVVGILAETQWYLRLLNHKKSVGVWLLIGFRVICFQTTLNTGGKVRLTRRLRRIHNAWRIQFKLA